MVRLLGIACIAMALLTVAESTYGFGTDDVIVRITKTGEIAPFKVSFDVMLRDRIGALQLKAIAEEIWKPGYERTFIGYFVQELGTEGGYWATTHWAGSKVDVRVFGLSKTEAAKQRRSKGPPVPDGAKLVGRWFFAGKVGGHVVIYRQKGKTFVFQRYPDGSGSPDEVREERHKDGRGFRVIDDYYDLWVLTPAGGLEVWDATGRVNFLIGERIE